MTAGIIESIISSTNPDSQRWKSLVSSLCNFDNLSDRRLSMDLSCNEGIQETKYQNEED